MSDPDDWIRGVVEQFSGPLTLYTLHLLGNLEQARDVVQETFIKLCAQRRDAIEPKLKYWLYLVCRNAAFDLLRKEKHMTPLTDAHEPASESATADEALEGTGQADMLRALEALPPNQREVIRLKFLHGQSYREISQLTSLSESNIGFLIHTGLKTLRRRLAGHDLKSNTL